MRLQRSILMAALLIGLNLWLVRQGCSEERQLQRRLIELARLIEKKGEEKPITTLNRMRRLTDFFSPDVHVDLHDVTPIITDRRDILLAIQNARAASTRIRINIRDQVVTLDRARRQARTRFVAEAKMETVAERAHEVREIEIVWLYTNSLWVISAATPVDSIRRVPVSQSP